jgi:hypothetical protein
MLCLKRQKKLKLKLVLEIIPPALSQLELRQSLPTLEEAEVGRV